MQLRSAIPWACFGLTILVCAGLVAGIAKRQATIDGLREDNQRLQTELKELDSFRAEAEKSRQLQNQQEEIQRLREDNKDLLRLRNEVRQLREQQDEVEALRTANADLLRVLQTANLPAPQSAQVVSARKKGAILGVHVSSADEVGARYRGVVVVALDPRTAADGHELKAGDIIVRMDGRAMENAAQLQSELLGRKPGEVAALDVMRSNTLLRVNVTLRAWPE